MNVTRREATLGIITLGVLLFGGTAIVGKPRLDRWKEVQSQREAFLEEMATDQALIASRDQWEKEYSGLKSKLYTHRGGGDIDAHWLSLMDNLAKKHGVEISRRETREERDLGDIYELPIECEWRASLPALVHFLFVLQTQGVMFDVRQLFVKPLGKGMLRGRFTLYCAYTRESSSGSAIAPTG